MAQDHKTQHNFTWDYAFPVPVLDIQQDYRLQQPGTMSRLVGVDGRYRSKLRRFPGFKVARTLPREIVDDTQSPSVTDAVIVGGINGLDLFQYAAFQKDVALNIVVRGFIFLGNNGSVDKLYIEQEGVPTSGRVLYNFGQAVTIVDVTTDHRNIYVVAELDNGNAVDVVVRFESLTSSSASNLNTFVAVPMSFDSPALTSVTDVSPASGKLVEGKTYSMAYRYVFPEQGLYTPISAVLTDTVTGAGNNAFRRTFDPEPDVIGSNGVGSVSNTSRVVIQLFRTTASDFATTSARGKLFLEQEIELVRASSNWAGGAIDFGADNSVGGGGTGLSDEALVLQDNLSSSEVQVFESGNPKAKRIEKFEELLIFGTAPLDADDARDTEILRWSFVELDRPNIIPIDNRRTPDDLGDTMQDLVRAGPFLAAVYDNSVIRIHRSGSRLAVDNLHNRYGSGGRFGSVAIGSNLYIVSPVGILILDLASGSLDVIGATQHFFDESADGHWRDDLADVHAVYDTELGAVIFQNTVKDETLLIWLNHGTVGLLKQSPWDDLAFGPDLASGGTKKAFFLVKTPNGFAVRGFDSGFSSGFGMTPAGGRVYQIDHNLSVGNQTMTGGAGLTFNTTAKTGSTSTSIIGQDADIYDTTMLGHYIRFIDGALAGEAQKISALSGTTFTTAAFTGSPAAGDKFSIGEIPFEVTMWPLSGDPRSPGVLDLIRSKTVNAMGLIIENLTGDVTSGNPNLEMTCQIFDRTSQSTAAKEGTASLLVDTTEGRTAKTVTALKFNAPIQVPGVECHSSDLGFDLLGVYLEGSIGRSKSDKRPTV